MEVTLTIRPLPVWDLPSTPERLRRSRNTFKADWQQTVDLLGRELALLDAKNGVICADFREQDLRRDGLPRAGAPAPAHPGIKVMFESKYGALSYATDSCRFWQHNVRSIALGLEALRAVDRYGVTRRGEQYTGWLAIESGATKMTADVAIQVLWEIAGCPSQVSPLEASARRESLTWLVRRAKIKAHPDVAGDRDQWDRMEQAARVLGLDL
jgi:hypothetical protein